jgi:hypothetical protein
MGNIRSVALPKFAKELIITRIHTYHSAPRLDYGFVPGLDAHMQQQFKQGMTYQMNAPILKAMAAYCFYSDEDIKKYSVVLGRYYSGRAAGPKTTVRLIFSDHTRVICDGIPRHWVDEEEWVLYPVEGFTGQARPGSAEKMVFGDTLPEMVHVLGLTSVEITCDLPAMPGVGLALDDRRGRVKEREGLVFNMLKDVKSARTTKQLLDVRPEFFDYIPPEIKRRMGVQDDG